MMAAFLSFLIDFLVCEVNGSLSLLKINVSLLTSPNLRKALVPCDRQKR